MKGKGKSEEKFEEEHQEKFSMEIIKSDKKQNGF